MIVETIQDFIFNVDYEETVLMQSDYLAYGIVFAYVVFVQFLGPWIMKQRTAFDLYYFVILFNALLVISNAYFCLTYSKFLRNYWHARCNFKYNPDYESSRRVIAYVGWQILLSKFLELFDTVIFILRKKFNQVSFLHVFHHSIIVLVVWAGLKRREITYYAVLIGVMNTGVHVFMYLYYGLSAIGPGVRKYLWWKKYLTTIQILQFFIFMSYLAYSFWTDCDEFEMFQKICFGFTSVVCILFINFYIKAYSKMKTVVQKKSHCGKRLDTNGVDSTICHN